MSAVTTLAYDAFKRVRTVTDTDNYVVTIDSDAHYIRELDYVRWGVSQARRAWVEPANVLNTRSRADLLAYLLSH